MTDDTRWHWTITGTERSDSPSASKHDFKEQGEASAELFGEVLEAILADFTGWGVLDEDYPITITIEPPGRSGPAKDSTPPKLPLSAERAAMLTTDERVRLAGQALANLGTHAKSLDASALADRIDKLTGVGFEAATLVVLASGY
jgi:hypothetical protein